MRTSRPRHRRASGVATAAPFVAFLVPLAGLTVFLAGGEVALSGGRSVPTTSDGFSAGTQVLVAQVCFWVAALVPLVAVAQWWRTGRWRDLPAVGLLAWVGGCAALTLLVLPQRGADAGGTAALPVHLTWIGCLAAALALLLGSRPPSQGPPTRIVDWTHPIRQDGLDELVTDLAARDRAASLADRDAALAVLVERGIVPPQTREAAAGLPLGHLVEAWPEGRRQ